MLDEIVCLGSISPDDMPDQHRVTGVVLHVEKSGEHPAYNLAFNRENTSVVHIGRRSGQESDKAHDGTLTSAMFRCAVVSRKHAKIVFSDSGHAYIIDSGSHHGTHLRKVGDPFPRKLTPEISTLLNDGDILTFGKPVGKADEWVKPIVAVVQLLYSPSPFKALTVPSPSSSDKSKSSSGRYGIHDSSEDSYSNSSDIEEITPPESPSTKVTSELQEQEANPTVTDPKPLDQSQDPVQVTAAYSSLRSLISPAIKRLPSVSEIIGDKGVGLFERSLFTLPTFPTPIRKQDDTEPFRFDAQHDILELRLDSRSSSPMDLGSPSPHAGVQPPVSRSLSTPLLSPVIESLGASFVPLFDLPFVPSASIVPELTPLSPVLASQDSRPESSSNLQPPSPLIIPHPAQTESPSTSSEIVDIQRTLKQLEASVNKLHDSRRKYKSRFNANVTFMSNKLSEINDKFAEVDAECNVLCNQVEELQHGDVPDLARQIEDLNEQVDAIIIDRDDDKFRTPEAQLPEPIPVEEAKLSVKSLNDLADEMRAFLVKSQVEFSYQLNDMKAAREEAMKSIEEVKAIASANSTTAANLSQGMQVSPSPEFVSMNEFIRVVDDRPPHQTPVPTSLKRKRDDMDEDEDAAVGPDETVDDPVTEVGELYVSGTERVAEMDEGDSTNDIAQGTDLVVEAIEPPPRKKIRTIGSVVARTATAATIGAVVTWSVLAFS